MSIVCLQLALGLVLGHPLENIEKKNKKKTKKTKLNCQIFFREALRKYAKFT